ncbi:MAG: hypothetical protein J6Z32_03915 [Bacteroidales bacterium]|nr:hypothetical protein [Bacteroidales bacterium]
MKKIKSYNSLLIRAFFLMMALWLLKPGTTLSAQTSQFEITISIDYIDEQEIYLSPNGETAVIHILSNNGFNAATLISSIENQIAYNGAEDWITEVFLTNQEGIYEADLNLTFAANNGTEMREVTITASNASAVIYQDIHTPNVYTLLPNVSALYLLHGGKNALILSSSDGFASYRLLKDSLGYTITVADVNGKSEGNRQLKFPITLPGAYYCIAYYPTEVLMNGTRTVQWHPFYDTQRNCSLSPNPYTFSKDGGKISFTYAVTAAQDSVLNRIINFYNSGKATTWDSTINLSYQRAFPNDSYVTITAECGPNISYNTINNNTYFKNQNASEIIFSQPGGGALNAFNVTFPEGNATPGFIILEGSQCRVRYTLLKDGVPYGNTRVGNGDTLRFNIPDASGKYAVAASYKGLQKLMKGSLTVNEGVAVLGENWILKQSFTSANAQSYILDVTYYDGLGYPAQTVNVAAAPNGKNIVTPIWYDVMRREDAKSYLPMVSSFASPRPEETPLSSQQAFYNSLYGSSDAAFAFTEKEYESSPLNRVKKEYTPGAAFRAVSTGVNHYSAFSYDANASNEVLDMSCNENGVLTVKGYLSAGKLFKNTITSPDGRVSTEFKDSEGTLYLAQSGTGNSISETYYVYDGRRQLRWVIQPEGTARVKTLAANSSAANPYTIANSDSTAILFAFLYNYDGLGRVSEKKIPGKGWEFIVYDPAGRSVATQDSLLREENRWILTRYDSLSRVTATYLSAQKTRAEVETAFQTPYPQIFSDQQNTLLSYSEYGKSAPAALAFSPVTGTVTSNDVDGRVKGLLTYSKVLDLSSSSMTPNLRRYREESYFYDKKGRTIQTVTKMPDGELLRSSASYDFVGNNLRSVQTLSVGTNATLQESENTLTQTFTYDSRARKLTATADLNNSSDTYAAVNYSYDNLGRLVNTKRGKTAAQGSASLNPSTATPVLENSLTYNIQGWINSQSDILKKGSEPAYNYNLYSQTLRYHDAVKASTAKSYDGLITEWEASQWKDASDWTNPGSTESRSSYAFSYDGQGRLTQGVRYIGTSTTSSDTFTEKNLSYDRNGNILTLRRFSENASNPKDDFTYSYTGNRIRHLAGTGEYLYDGNGNMTKDALRNVVMTYDLNNQVKTVSRNDTLLSNYTYLADGTKYKVIDKDGNGRAYVGPFTLEVDASNNTTKEYLESAEAESGRILAVRQMSGASTNTSYTTLFLVKDHLGSTRAVSDSQGNILERNSYYPFGLQTNQGESYPTINTSLNALYPNRVSATQAKRDLYNGKEIQTVAGTDYLDYGFRQYDPVTARWMAIDPKAEKYLTLTPYNYCSGNPILFTDIIGDSLTIIGEYSFEALLQLQEKVGKSITLSINPEGKVSYEKNREKLRGIVKTMAKMIDRNDVFVVMGTTDEEKTPEGNIFIGGAFMGNRVSTNQLGETVVDAFQLVNTRILDTIDEFFETPGQSIWHELTEAFIGAEISKSTKQDASPAYSESNNRTFKEAHRKAGKQHTIKNRYYNNGEITDNMYEANQVEWYIENGKDITIIQTYPRK